MNNSFKIIICLFIAFSCRSQDTIHWYQIHKPFDRLGPHYFCEKEFDGKKIKEGFRVNDSVYNEMRLYEQGKLLCILFFINEEQNGPFASYYFESGKIHEVGQFKNGKKEGVWKEYDINGKLISTKKYKNNIQVE